MDYIELSCKIDPFTQIFADLLMAELGEIGYDSFTQDLGDIKAYITENLFDFEAAQKLDIITSKQYGTVALSHQKIVTQNWNALWESNFDPVIAADNCIVRAPFHTLDKEYTYDIVIEPKMSFGTGHHQTTQLILEKLLTIDIDGKTVADCGCGTGVLGILASMRGAESVFAFDNDDWAYQNTVENTERNNIHNMETLCGTLELLKGRSFDIVIANINRNILIEGMQYISAAVKPGGTIIFSGIFVEDVEIMTHASAEFGLKYVESQTKDKWARAIYTK